MEKGLESAAGKGGWDVKLQCKWLGLSVMLLGTMSFSIAKEFLHSFETSYVRTP
jgi:hypothetical protein